MQSAISVQQVSKAFAQFKVLKDIDINVPKGAIYGFLGNNGAGKSTLIRLLLGLLKVDAGQIWISGRKIGFDDINYKKQIGCLVDSPVLYSHLTPKEFLSISVKAKRLPKNSIEHALTLVNMQQYLNRPMNNFSLGMKQRIALANALIGKPKLLILDEPTNGLDPEGMQEVRQLLTRLPDRMGATIFLSSHLLDEIEKTATHVGILHKGEIKVEASMKNLREQAKSKLKIVTTKPEQLVDYLAGYDIKGRLDEHQTVCVPVANKAECSTLNQAVVEGGFELLESYFVRDSLEQQFLNLVANGEGVN